MSTQIKENSPTKIFISYKHNANPDGALAKSIYDTLSQKYDVFWDQESIPVGQNWAERIQQELSTSDFLIPLLSSAALESEMVKGEIERAHQAKSTTILPVRVAHEEPFDYPISAYLNSIQWTSWHNQDDTNRLVQELLAAIEGVPLSYTEQPSHSAPVELNRLHVPRPTAQLLLELPEGTMNPLSTFYISRESDTIAEEAIIRPGGATISIKGPRQVGKSSLLMRIIEEAQKSSKKVVYLDFQQVEQETLTDASTFFRRFCSWITDRLDLEDKVEEVWKRPLGNKQLCTRYVEKYLLEAINSHLVLAMDEVERVLEAPFNEDFFSMLRSWHNERARNPIWQQLDLVLVTSTEPYQLIKDLTMSPFNVGEIIEIKDFTIEQINELNEPHGNIFSASFITDLYECLHGHPFLTRRAMYLVASQRYTEKQIIEEAPEDSGPFGDHLRYHLFRIYDKDDPNKLALLQGFSQILRYNGCEDQDTVRRLKAAGLVREEDNKLVARSRLYENYFKDRLND